jgi:chorismate-pyruvate lyase
MHLSKLNESLRLLTEDVPRQRRRVETNEMPPDLYRQLVGIEILLGRLESMVNVLKQQLEQFRVNCAHQELQRIKERGAELGHLVARLNERL